MTKAGSSGADLLLVKVRGVRGWEGGIVTERERKRGREARQRGEIERWRLKDKPVNDVDWFLHRSNLSTREDGRD